MYGRHTIADCAHFRLVFGPDQVEKRLATKNNYLGEIFLSEETGIFELPKYDYLEADRVWILERIIGNQHSDVYDGSYIYEPLYAYNIFPTYRALEFYINGIINRKPSKRTQKDADYDEAERMKKEKERTKDLFGNFTALGTSLEDRSAISFSNVDFRPSKQVSNE